ncbi:MAG: 16S rRNA processing protein RimM [Desulfobulbus propionicus]|nr:MAG: 16S rRNA processing protein RimM [Desulfobulbus propionicus]
MQQGSSGENRYLLLGKVVKAHGIRGEIKVFADSGQPENFRDYPRVFLGEAEAFPEKAYTVRQVRPQGRMVLLGLHEIDHRNAAEHLVGRSVWLHLDDLPANGRLYLHELEGKLAHSADGRVLGRVSGFLQRPGQDVMRIFAGDREYLVPVVAEFILQIDEERVVLELPPGLLEINRPERV